MLIFLTIHDAFYSFGKGAWKSIRAKIIKIQGSRENLQISRSQGARK